MIEKLYEDKRGFFVVERYFGPIWSDPVWRRRVFPARFGRFGCIADCGAYEYLVLGNTSATNEHSIADFLLRHPESLHSRTLSSF